MWYCKIFLLRRKQNKLIKDCLKLSRKFHIYIHILTQYSEEKNQYYATHYYQRRVPQFSLYLPRLIALFTQTT